MATQMIHENEQQTVKSQQGFDVVLRSQLGNEHDCGKYVRTDYAAQRPNGRKWYCISRFTFKSNGRTQWSKAVSV